MQTMEGFRKTAAYLLAALTALAGFASLGLFAWFLSANALRPVRLGMSSPGALAWDALLCLVFFTQHSGMVRRSFRSWSGRRVPACLHGALYTLASAAALTLLCLLWQPAGPALLVPDGAVRGILRGISLLALLGFVWAIVSLDVFDAFSTGALLPAFSRREPAAPRLTLKGPYRWVRHPFYFFAIILLWASATVSWDRLLLNVLFTIWIVLGARWEERDLITVFGDAYHRIQKEVPMLIPYRLPKPRRRAEAAQ